MRASIFQNLAKLRRNKLHRSITETPQTTCAIVRGTNNLTSFNCRIYSSVLDEYRKLGFIKKMRQIIGNFLMRLFFFIFTDAPSCLVVYDSATDGRRCLYSECRERYFTDAPFYLAATNGKKRRDFLQAQLSIHLLTHYFHVAV